MGRPLPLPLHAVLPLALAAAAPFAAGAQEAAEFDPARFVSAHCATCHGVEKTKGDLDLVELLARGGDSALAAARWRDVDQRLALGEMPPEDRPRPEPAELEAMREWIGERLASAPPAAVDVGRPTLRRLNRFEYENTVRDLFEVDFDAAAVFPVDDVGHGFDNIGDVLSMSDLLLEKYLDAAEEIAARAVGALDPETAAGLRVEPRELTIQGRRVTGSDELRLNTNSSASVVVRVGRDGEYLLEAGAWAQQAGDEPARLALYADDREVATFDVLAGRDEPGEYTAPVLLGAGERKLSVGFVNDYYEPDHPDPARRDRNLIVRHLELSGPSLTVAAPPLVRRYGLDDPASDPREALADLARRVWRRPVDRDDVRRLLQLSDPGDSPAERVQRGLVGLLASPHFLFRIERDPDPEDATPHPLADHELATRLAYFLWSSTPDDQLLDLADAGRLHEPAVLHGQVERLLRDARSHALAESFATQWLQLRALAEAAPDPRRFPGFDEELREAMRAETLMLFEAVLREERGVRELLDPGFTFLNERLAEHYSIGGVRGPSPRRVALTPTQRELRGGLLGQAALLLVTSNPTRTSPVKRGKWILESLLGAPPPPPPPGVGDLRDDAEAAREASLRERLDQHRADPECASCHGRMDPLGFGLENFDAVGAWRTRDGSFEVDARGTLPDGRSFEGPAGLKRILLDDERFVRQLAEQLATYALGRGLVEGDRPAIDQLLAGLPPGDPTLAQLIHGVVSMQAFRHRRPEQRNER